MSKLILTTLTVFSLLLPQASWAHPHIWVYTNVELVTDQNKITALKVHWNFDELYSASFLEDADLNGNRILEEDEAQVVVSSVFEETPENLLPFVYLRWGGEAATFKFSEPKAWMDDNETLNYTFSIVLDEPVEMGGEHSIGFFDPEFYVSFEQELDIKLGKNTSCTSNLEENKNITIYDGLVNPETYTLNCQKG